MYLFEMVFLRPKVGNFDIWSKLKDYLSDKHLGPVKLEIKIRNIVL